MQNARGHDTHTNDHDSTIDSSPDGNGTDHGIDLQEHHVADQDHAPERSDQSAHSGHESNSAHGSAHTDHSGHEEMFRQRFWVSLVLSVPVLVWSDTIQQWFGYTAPQFPGSALIVPVIATAVFLYGGLPFLQMAAGELRERSPGMMTLISMAITVAYAFSMATLVFDLGQDFFWELVTLIDIMLLGHWLEMRSVRQASGALDALATLMPDTAEVVQADGSVQTRPAGELGVVDVFLVPPGSSVPADGQVLEGSSEFNEAMITGESRPVDKSPGDQLRVRSPVSVVRSVPAW